MGGFIDLMEDGHAAFGAEAGGRWRVRGTDVARDAFCIETLSAQERAMAGGRLNQVEAILHVTTAVFAASGAAAETVVEVELDGAWRKVRIDSIARDGDGAVTLICGPVGV